MSDDTSSFWYHNQGCHSEHFVQISKHYHNNILKCYCSTLKLQVSLNSKTVFLFSDEYNLALDTRYSKCIWFNNLCVLISRKIRGNIYLGL